MSYFAGYQVTRAVDNFRTSKLRCGGRMEEKASLPELYWIHSTLRSWPLAFHQHSQRTDEQTHLTVVRRRDFGTLALKKLMMS